MKRFAIIGAGGFAREVLSYLHEQISADNEVFFVVDDHYFVAEQIVCGLPVMKRSDFTEQSEDVRVLVAVADPKVRAEMLRRMPLGVIHHTLVSKYARTYDCVIGAGGIVCPGTVVTCNVDIGKFCHLNLNTTVGHDCVIGDYFTTAPGVHISGNVKIGDRVYFGTNASVREKISICDDVTIGMGSVVVKDIVEPGVYAGIPARRIR
jgi:sugar O-acyltransferase (sialic acid O-acetyltransferase NeuD family)